MGRQVGPQNNKTGFYNFTIGSEKNTIF